MCFGLCNDGSNTHFGTQYGKECWCVNDPEEESINQFSDVAASCDFSCAGDSSELCGGFDAMSVYEITTEDSVEPEVFCFGSLSEGKDVR